MPSVKAKDLRTLTLDELVTKAESVRKELFQLRFDAKLGKLDTLSKLQLKRRELAKILTVKREMELKKNA